MLGQIGQISYNQNVKGYSEEQSTTPEASEDTNFPKSSNLGGNTHQEVFGFAP